MKRTVPLRRRSLARIAALAAAALAAACAPESAPPGPNVLVVLIDTLRADRLGAYGNPGGRTPHLDRVLRGARQFARATAPSSWTLPSAASLLTGLYPTSHGATNVNTAIADGAPTAPEIFAAAGWRTAAFVSTNLVGSPYGFDRGFEAFDESNARGHRHVSSPSLTDLAGVWLWGWKGGARAPFFLLVHYYDPHAEYLSHAALLDHPVERDPETGEVPDLARYDSEVRFTDRHLGILLRELEALGALDDAVVVVTADHGEAFGEHGAQGHHENLYEEAVHVPLGIAAPGIRPGIAGDPVSTVAILPTLLALCDLERDTPETDEGSLLPEPDSASSEVLTELAWIPFDTQRAGEEEQARFDPRGVRLRRSVRVGDWKAHHDEQANTWELYDLSVDPGETANLAEREPAKLRELQERLDRRTARLRARAELASPTKVQMADSLLQNLRALGYVQ